MSSSDIRRRETVTQPYYAAIESVADPNTRRVLRDIYDHLPLDYVTRDDLPDVTQVVRETVVVPQFVDRGFVDRGDPAAPDWTHEDLTCDGHWHVLDLTTVNAAIAGATEVQLRLVFTSQSGHVKFRRHGCVNEVNVEERYYYYTYLQKYTTIHVAPDENGRIDYWAESGLTHFDLTVSGWWTGYGSEGTGSSSEIALNSAHRLGDGSDHADVAANTAHRLGDGSDHADVAANTAHRLGDGSDHADVADNTAHRLGDGTDHSAIATGHPHQRVGTTSSPSFAGLSVACASEPIANFRGTYSSTTTHRIYITNSLDADTANRAAISFRCNSSTQTRTAAEIMGGLSTVTDASRVGVLEFSTADAGKAPATRMAIRGSQIGFFGVTPVSRDTGWSVTNVTTDRSYDADATTVDELADVLGTLIKYLISLGLLGA